MAAALSSPYRRSVFETAAFKRLGVRARAGRTGGVLPRVSGGPLGSRSRRPLELTIRHQGWYDGRSLSPGGIYSAGGREV